jgi:hypothetical protein
MNTEQGHVAESSLFESHQVHLLSWLKFLCFSSLTQDRRRYSTSLQLDHEHFPPHTLHSIIEHPQYRRGYLAWHTDS